MAVVADHDHGAAEADQSLDQRLARLHVEMVGGLVQNQNMRRVPRDQRKRQPRPLSSAELAHRQIHLVAGKSEAAELRESSKILRKQVAEAEAEVKRLWQKRGEIDEMLARPNANGSSVAELMKARAEIERRLAAAEQTWLEASEAVERAQR